MKINNFKHRESDYFNEVDEYLVETNLNKLLVTRLHKHNGSWYTNSGMRYKATSVRLIKAMDALYNERVSCIDDKERSGKGTIVKFLEPYYLGIIWDQGSKINPMFWVNINEKDLKNDT